MKFDAVACRWCVMIETNLHVISLSPLARICQKTIDYLYEFVIKYSLHVCRSRMKYLDDRTVLFIFPLLPSSVSHCVSNTRTHSYWISTVSVNMQYINCVEIIAVISSKTRLFKTDGMPRISFNLCQNWLMDIHWASSLSNHCWCFPLVDMS